VKRAALGTRSAGILLREQKISNRTPFGRGTTLATMNNEFVACHEYPTITQTDEKRMML